MKTEQFLSKIAKKVFKELIEKGGIADDIVKAKGLVQISDEGTLRTMVVRNTSSKSTINRDYKEGKGRALGFLVGQIMKASKGQANPQLVNKILLEEIEKH